MMAGSEFEGGNLAPLKRENVQLRRALTLYIGAIEHKAAIPKVDASAQKQARKVVRSLQELGYYRGLEVLA